MVKVKIPFRGDKNLGKAYNDAFECTMDDDWICLIDHDVMFLTSDAILILEEYTKKYPDTGIFTCFTNRLHVLSKDQLLGGKVCESHDIKFHKQLAYHQKVHLFNVTEINHEIGGFLMLVSKKTWDDVKFNEDMKCLGVDNDYSWRVMAKGKRILRMDGVYVYHQYRIDDVTDKTHLL